MDNSERKFKSKLGFILTCVGSAVGMANIWAFPYRVGKYGGAVFLIVYIGFIILFSNVGLSAEYLIGRFSGTGTLGSYERAWKDKNLSKLGYILAYIPLIGSLTIAIGYAVISAWVLRTFGASVTGKIMTVNPEVFFNEGAAGGFVIAPWHIAVVVIALFTILAGAKSMEITNKIMMPLFFILFIFLAIRVSFLEGAIEGYKYLLIPQWEYLFKVDTWANAMGQAFFSLSCTGSGMIVCGAYLDKKEDIADSAVKTGIYDTVAAMVAAFVVIPAAFAFGYGPSAGPSLMFITIPRVFQQMTGGRTLAIIFFISVVFAAVSSLQNMLEVVGESIITRFKIHRKVVLVFLGLLTLGIGFMINSGDKVGPWMDVVAIYIIPFGAVLGAISWYYMFDKKSFMEELNMGSIKPRGEIYHNIGKYVYVPLTILVFILGIIYQGI